MRLTLAIVTLLLLTACASKTTYTLMDCPAPRTVTACSESK